MQRRQGGLESLNRLAYAADEHTRADSGVRKRVEQGLEQGRHIPVARAYGFGQFVEGRDDAVAESVCHILADVLPLLLHLLAPLHDFGGGVAQGDEFLRRLVDDRVLFAECFKPSVAAGRHFRVVLRCVLDLLRILPHLGVEFCQSIGLVLRLVFSEIAKQRGKRIVVVVVVGDGYGGLFRCAQFAFQLLVGIGEARHLGAGFLQRIVIQQPSECALAFKVGHPRLRLSQQLFVGDVERGGLVPRLGYRPAQFVVICAGLRRFLRALE